MTVIGIAKKDGLLLASSQKNDLLVTVGLPLVGEEVLPNIDKIAGLDDLKKLMAINDVHEIIPVGSKGIGYEVDLLAEMSGLSCKYREGLGLALDKSAGPATTILASMTRNGLKQVKLKIEKPITVIGKLKS